MKVGDMISNYVLVDVANSRGKNRYYTCQCRNCGNVKEVAVSNLRTKVGKYGTCELCDTDNHPLYSTWKSMMTRCYNKNSLDYKYYGGRGITVCDEWVESFWHFYWDMGLRPSGYTLDRKDNNGPYSQDNCRWATKIEQQSNTSKNVVLDFYGVLVTEAEFSRMSGVPRTTIQSRRRRGLTSTQELLSGLADV